MRTMKTAIILLTLVMTATFAIHAAADTMKVKSADGVPIAYQVHGKGDIALVLIHCWCCDKSFWDAQVPVLAKDYKVVTLDLGGHGESGTDRENWTLQAFGKDVAAVIKKLKLGKLILVGHSMGGPVAVETAHLLPDQVLGIVAVDTLLNVEQKFTKEQFDQFMAPMRKDFKGFAEKFLRAFMFTPKSDPELVDKIVKKMTSAKPEIALGAWENMFKYDIPKAMDKIKVPFRLIVADLHPYDIEAGKRHAISFKVKVMKGVGHFLHMEKPDTFNKLLIETLKELTTATAK